MNRILIVRLGAIGDVIMASPMLEHLWRLHPDCRVDWLVGNISAPILECIADPRLTIVRADERKIFRGSTLERIGAILSVWRRLGLARYDRVLILNSDPRYAILPLLCRGSRHWFRAGDSRGVIPGRHHSVEYLRMVTDLDDSSSPWPVYPPVRLPALPDEVEVAIKSDTPVVAISPAGARNVMREEGLRRWTIDGYKKVAQGLRAEGCKVILVGGPGDRWASEAMADCCDLDFVGSLDLSAFLSLLSRVDLVVSHDSGPLHMADFVGTPVVGIFGPTLAEEKRPIAVPHRIVIGAPILACRPCYDGSRYAACSNTRCMTDITPEQVLVAAMGLLAR